LPPEKLLQLFSTNFFASNFLVKALTVKVLAVNFFVEKQEIDEHI
jgi:hypothetical protein